MRAFVVNLGRDGRSVGLGKLLGSRQVAAAYTGVSRLSCKGPDGILGFAGHRVSIVYSLLFVFYNSLKM